MTIESTPSYLIMSAVASKLVIDVLDWKRDDCMNDMTYNSRYDNCFAFTINHFLFWLLSKASQELKDALNKKVFFYASNETKNRILYSVPLEFVCYKSGIIEYKD